MSRISISRAKYKFEHCEQTPAKITYIMVVIKKLYKDHIILHL